MERREKTEFILEQVTLCIEKGDWTQADILSRKINTKFFARKPKKTSEQIEKNKKEREEKKKNRNINDSSLEKKNDVINLKLRYYEQQITLTKYKNKYLNACKHYRQVLNTEFVKENPEQLYAVSELIARFSVFLPLTTFRFFKESSIIFFSPLTTMSNSTFSIASTSIFVTLSSSTSSNCSKPSLFLNLCVDSSFSSVLTLTFAL